MPGDIVFTASTVGQLVAYIAPGFLAFMGYRLRYPGPDRGAGEQLVISVALSLPLVAAVNAVLGGSHKVTNVWYVLALLGVAFLAGYVGALIRGTKRFKNCVAVVGYRLEPESSIYAQTLSHMSDEATVVVEFKDGRKLWGCPRNGPQHKDDGISELYLVYPKALGDDGQWTKLGPGVVVPLTEVSNVVLSEEPTGAPVPPEFGSGPEEPSAGESGEDHGEGGEAEEVAA